MTLAATGRLGCREWHNGRLPLPGEGIHRLHRPLCKDADGPLRQRQGDMLAAAA
jgi:hypothetical protein